MIPGDVRTCPNCHTELGTVVEIQEKGRPLMALQSGHYQIFNSNGRCDTCHKPFFWNADTGQLQKLLTGATGREVKESELTVSAETHT